MGESMKFCRLLDSYMTAFDCSPTELVSLSGVSAATVSRYRAGTRTPSSGSAQFSGIVSGLSKAAARAGLAVPEEEICRELTASLREENPFDFAVFRINLNTLLGRMHLNARQAAAAVGMDDTAFSRVRSGQRRPSDLNGFCRRVARYICAAGQDSLSRDILSDILSCSAAELEREPEAVALIAGWLMNGAKTQRQHARDFLLELDRFDLDHYIAHFDRPSAGSAPDGARNAGAAEEAFLRAVPEAAPEGTAYICTDIVFGGEGRGAGCFPELDCITAMLIRRGYRVRLVFNTDQPVDALLARLEALMPVFMSGRVEAYFLKGRRDDVYRCRLISLPDAAICVEAINGYEASACAYASRDPAEAAAFRARAEQIFGYAEPLIEIFDRDDNRRAAAVREDRQRSGKRFSFLSTPPIYTIDDSLMGDILRRNGIGTDDARRIRQYVSAERTRILSILRHTEIVDCVPDVSAPAFAERPVFFSLSGLFYEREILYTFEEYQAHMSLTRAFELRNRRYHVVANENAMFRNVQIFINEGYWIMLSKNRTPAIHLFIRHPKLRQAFENMLLLYGNI